MTKIRKTLALLLCLCMLWGTAALAEDAAATTGSATTAVTELNGTDVLATINGDPFIAVGQFGKGRSAVFTSDCAPHWAPQSFLDSPAYGTLWKNLADWATDSL